MSKKKNLKEEEYPKSRARTGQEQDPTQRIIDQNDTMIEYLENMTNSLNAMVYYATKSRGATADIEKSIGSTFVNEGKEKNPVTSSADTSEEEKEDVQALYDRSVEKEKVAEATMQAGKEQTYPSVDATDQRTDFPGTDDRVADPRNESKISIQELKDLIREQLFITRKNK